MAKPLIFFKATFRKWKESDGRKEIFVIRSDETVFASKFLLAFCRRAEAQKLKRLVRNHVSDWVARVEKLHAGRNRRFECAFLQEHLMDTPHVKNKLPSLEYIVLSFEVRLSLAFLDSVITDCALSLPAIESCPIKMLGVCGRDSFFADVCFSSSDGARAAWETGITFVVSGSSSTVSCLL